MPATYAAYPAEADVEALLSGAGVTVPSGLDVDPYIYAAIEEWEELTRQRPFLGETADRVYTYDPPGPNRFGERRGGAKILVLDRGFVSITTVKTGVSTTDAGTALTLGTDYRLEPVNAVRDLVPYTAIHFTQYQWGSPQSITVTGKAGWSAALTAEAWNAIRELAASGVVRALREGFASEPLIWSEGDVSEHYDVTQMTKLGDSWYDRGRRTALRLRRF